MGHFPVDRVVFLSHVGGGPKDVTQPGIFLFASTPQYVSTSIFAAQAKQRAIRALQHFSGCVGSFFTHSSGFGFLAQYLATLRPAHADLQVRVFARQHPGLATHVLPALSTKLHGTAQHKVFPSL